MYDYEELVGVT